MRRTNLFDAGACEAIVGPGRDPCAKIQSRSFASIRRKRSRAVALRSTFILSSAPCQAARRKAPRSAAPSSSGPGQGKARARIVSIARLQAWSLPIGHVSARREGFQPSDKLSGTIFPYYGAKAARCFVSGDQMTAIDKVKYLQFVNCSGLVPLGWRGKDERSMSPAKAYL